MKTINLKIQPVILSGGSGTRLWPLSRGDRPKQYLSLDGDNSMLQETIFRLNGLENILDPIIVCNAEHRFLVAEQCRNIGVCNPTILLEPVGRNTAPAITAAALWSLGQIDDSVLLVLSADHIIQDVVTFHKAIGIASLQAKEGKLVTFGVVPISPNTGYGYIKTSKQSSGSVLNVEKFVEKPDLATAKSYLEQEGYFWNSGMFVFRSNALIDGISTHSPEILASIDRAVNKAKQDLDFIRLDASAFESSPSDSIDYALMEKSDNVVVIPLDAKWNDIGSWSALYDIGIKDANGNVTKGDVVTKDVTNTYINADHHMVAAVGVDNLVVVDTPDVTFISTRDKSQEVKSIVGLLEYSDRVESESHRKTYRPWGWYDSIESGENFQVKRLYINPGAKLSMQKHENRAEHWVVVIGTASVINGGKNLTLEKGESTYIPIGTIHSLENKTNKPLEIIEVQSGSYLGEDDIMRFEDIYGRI